MKTQSAYCNCECRCWTSYKDGICDCDCDGGNGKKCGCVLPAHGNPTLKYDAAKRQWRWHFEPTDVDPPTRSKPQQTQYSPPHRVPVQAQSPAAVALRESEPSRLTQAGVTERVQDFDHWQPDDDWDYPTLPSRRFSPDDRRVGAAAYDNFDRRYELSTLVENEWEAGLCEGPAS